MPRIKNKSKQYLFKNKFNIRRKSKREIIMESFFMMISGFFLLLMNYLIPKKFILINSLKNNLYGIFKNVWEILLYSFEILIVLFISLSLITATFLIIGSINRLIKVFLRKSSKIRFL